MRFTFLKKRPLLTACLCVALFSLSGCLVKNIIPDIVESEWEYLRVVYLERDENDELQPRTWHTTDQEVLANIKATFPRSGKYGSTSGKPAQSRSNRVDIKLQGGQWWSLAYLSKDQIHFLDSNSNHSRFGTLKECNPEIFYTTLTNEIMRVSGTAVNLKINFHSYEEAEKLGRKSAAWHEWVFPK